ncbi:MAG: DUF3298 and DUF4163 domain-containing protein [Acidobacteria bacterium]|nr:DUF3298 and DUF4163 domain-containing protein [Acidobacteriota bacterium]
MKIQHFRYISIGLLLFTMLGVAGSVSAQHVFLSGSVGSSKLEMDLTRSGGSLSGTYYYHRSGSGNKLKLSGQISSDGSFTMQESDSSGKVTGTFKGKWSEDPDLPGVSLDGTWSKPGEKGDGQGFYAFEQMIYFTNTKIIDREYKETIKAKRADLSATYPELSGNANAAGFNALSKARAMQSLAAFRKDLNSLTAADIKRMSGDNMGSYIEVGYNVEYADDSLISISYSEDTFEGGAHPNHDFFALTYDLKAGRELKLADLFKPGAKYLQTIAKYCLHNLQNKKDPETGEKLDIATDIFADGAKPTLANYKNWNVTNKGLLISFPPYQVAAYVYGPQWVLVPYSELKSIAKKDGALARVNK